MSSLVIFKDEQTGVVAEWNKGEPYTVRVDADGASTPPRLYPNEASAVAAAKRLALRLSSEARTPLNPMETFPKTGRALVAVKVGKRSPTLVIGSRESDGRLVSDSLYHLVGACGWLPLPKI